MSTWVVAPSGLIEPVPAPEIYADGIGAIELIQGTNVRIYFYADQLPIESGPIPPQKVIVAKLIRPVIGVPETIGQLAQCLWRPPIVMPDYGPRLVK